MYPTAIANDEFFVKFKNCEITGGIIILNACGRIIKLIVLPGEMPNA